MMARLSLLALLLAPAAVHAFWMPQRGLRAKTIPRASAARGAVAMKADWALLFDCDGVLADTERDGACVRVCVCVLCVCLGTLPVMDRWIEAACLPCHLHVSMTGHRPAFNLAFQQKGIQCDWTVPLYGELLKIGGGKERMTAHWNKVGWPAG